MTPGPRPALQRTVLLDHLLRQWARFAAEPAPPPLDRWLTRELGGEGVLGGMKRPQRLWLGAQLREMTRFATLAAFADHAGLALARGLQAWERPADLWPRLQALEPAAVAFWAFLRLRHRGERLPRLPEPRPGAMKVWSALRARCDGAADLPAGLLWAGVAPWHAGALARRAQASGWDAAQTRRFAERHESAPPLWLRVNRPEHLEKILRELRHDDFTVTVDGDALAAVGAVGVQALTCRREGLVEVQDWASQAIGEAVGARPGDFVWDVCAGGGGKSLQLAAAMGGRGAVYATDVHAGRLQDLRRRARRAGFTSIRAHAWDGASLPDFGATVARRGGFDRVLVDAPCSGSGTWRRNPDGRLRPLDELPRLVAAQRRLLDVAAGAVRPGGRLVHATCSWLVEENEDVVAGFLAGHGDFALVSQAVHGNPAADADTTFAAVLARRGGPEGAA